MDSRRISLRDASWRKGLGRLGQVQENELGNRMPKSAATYAEPAFGCQVSNLGDFGGFFLHIPGIYVAFVALISRAIYGYSVIPYPPKRWLVTRASVGITI
jgi:hypothetical protein